MDFASKGVANAGLGFGLAGTALGVLNGGLGNLLGLGGYNNAAYISENMPVTRYEMGLQQANSALESENALLKADKYTDQKIVEVFTALDSRIRDMEREQTKVNMDQAVYNGVNTATLNCMQSQIGQLFSLTRLSVPNTSICPGWGGVTVTPTTATATTAG